MKPDEADHDASTAASGTSTDNVEVAVVRFPATMDSPGQRRLADLPDRVVAGDPRHTSMTRYTSADQRLQTGTWTSTPGKWRVFSGRDEFCTMLSGHVALIAASGTRQEFVAGDSFLIPNGFEGFWEVMETATKHFVILHEAGTSQG